MYWHDLFALHTLICSTLPSGAWWLQESELAKVDVEPLMHTYTHEKPAQQATHTRMYHIIYIYSCDDDTDVMSTNAAARRWQSRRCESRSVMLTRALVGVASCFADRRTVTQRWSMLLR